MNQPHERGEHLLARTLAKKAGCRTARRDTGGRHEAALLEGPVIHRRRDGVQGEGEDEEGDDRSSEGRHRPGSPPGSMASRPARRRGRATRRASWIPPPSSSILPVRWQSKTPREGAALPTPTRLHDPVRGRHNRPLAQAALAQAGFLGGRARAARHLPHPGTGPGQRRAARAAHPLQFRAGEHPPETPQPRERGTDKRGSEARVPGLWPTPARGPDDPRRLPDTMAAVETTNGQDAA